MSVLDSLDLRVPVVQAPMGGGFTTAELVAAVCEAGALGSLAAPYLQPEAIGPAIEAVRARTGKPFLVNLFVFDSPAPDQDLIARTSARLAPYCRELGIEPPAFTSPGHPDIARQIEAVLAARPAVFSFTFGIPPRAVIDECRRLGILTVGTATTLAEGLALEAAGVDAVCAQGSEAGAHRGTFLHSWREGMVGITALTSILAARLKVPVIAAGGIMNGAAAAGLMRTGAAAVQLGTAFLTCPEAGTPETHRKAILSAGSDRTAITTAFSGRAARGIVNRYMEELEGAELAPFPILNAMTRGVRGAAAKAGRGEFMSLWAGQGAPLARVLPAAELVAALEAEMSGSCVRAPG
jgi:nitronate monooxygenase